MRYEIRPAALRDIRRHRAYLAAQNPQAALKFETVITATIEQIARQPALLGHGDGWRRHAGVRSLRVPGFEYLVFFRPLKDIVEIKRVLHGRRNLPPHFGR